MKKILVFGDSNTWGYKPVSGKRYKLEFRWTFLLQRKINLFNENFRVIADGLNGRCLVGQPFSWINKINLEGASQIKGFTDQFNNYDVLIIALGTNDILSDINPIIDAKALTNHLELFNQNIDYKENVKKIFIAPHNLASEAAHLSNETIQKTYRDFCLKHDYTLIETHDINPPNESDGGDGVHFGIVNHNDLATRVYREIIKLFDLKSIQ